VDVVPSVAPPAAVNCMEDFSTDLGEDLWDQDIAHKTKLQLQLFLTGGFRKPCAYGYSAPVGIFLVVEWWLLIEMNQWVVGNACRTTSNHSQNTKTPMSWLILGLRRVHR
jgi:hypothetical protein